MSDELTESSAAVEEPCDTVSQGSFAALEERLVGRRRPSGTSTSTPAARAADFDNYRKRAARDQERLVARAHERLVRELLPVLDDLERALEAATEHEEATLARASARPRELAARSPGGPGRDPDRGRVRPARHEALLAQPIGRRGGLVLEVVQRATASATASSVRRGWSSPGGE